MKTTAAILFALLLPLSAQAHEGHDHDSPKGQRAVRGGIVKVLERVHVEVVAKGTDVKVYLFPLEGEKKALDPAAFALSAAAELPRTKKSEPLKLTLKPDVAEATFDAKGAHRYTFVLKLTDPELKHEDTLKFTVEPRK